MELSQTLRSVPVAVLLAGFSLSASAETAFDRGVSAFKQKDYEVALAFFEQSLQEENATAILYFNLASSYYKLRRYPEARRYYLESANDAELAALSYFNLGLIAQKEDDKQAAYSAFRKSFELAQDENLSYFAAKKLEEFESERDKKSLVDKFSGLISLSFAHDDNVALVNDLITTVTGKSDNYLDLFGIATYQLSGDGF